MSCFSVIICYNPNIDNIALLIERLEANAVSCLLVDNGSKNVEKLKNLIFDNKFGHILISLMENHGIAHAQNVGIEKAIQLGADSIVFFDQDSIIDDNFIPNLILDYQSLCKMGEKIAAIGPQFIDQELGFYAPGLIVKKNGLINKIDISKISKPQEVGIIISSGSLISIDVLNDVGLMNEDFFIDYVDTEWCLRALNKNYKIYVSNKAIMYHSVGDATIRIFGLTCPVHSAFRRYYRVRNLFLMWDMMHVSKKWVIKMFIHNLIAQIILFCTQNKRSSYIYYLIIAIIDGMKGKKGSL